MIRWARNYKLEIKNLSVHAKAGMEAIGTDKFLIGLSIKPISVKGIDYGGLDKSMFCMFVVHFEEVFW